MLTRLCTPTFALTLMASATISLYGCTDGDPPTPSAAESAQPPGGQVAGAVQGGSASGAAAPSAIAAAPGSPGAAGAAGAAQGAGLAPGAAGAAGAAAGVAPGAAGAGGAAAGVAPLIAAGGAGAGALTTGAAGAVAAAGAGATLPTAAVAAAGAGAIPLVSGAASQGVRAAASMAAPPPAVTFAEAKSAERLMTRGNDALSAGNNSGALDLFRKAAELGPGLAGPLFGMATSLLGLGQNAAALGALSQLHGLGTKASLAKLALAATSALFDVLRSDPETKDEFERITSVAKKTPNAALFVGVPKAGITAHDYYRETISSLDTFLSDPSDATCVSLTQKGAMSEDGKKVPSTSLVIQDCKTNKRLGTRPVLSAQKYAKLTKAESTGASIHPELSKTEGWLVEMNMNEWAPVSAEGRAKVQERIKASGLSSLPKGDLPNLRASLSGRRLATRSAKGQWRVFAADIEAEGKRVEAKKSCAHTRKSCIKGCWTECQKTMQCTQVMRCENKCRAGQKTCEAAL
jgi:hypothetical protein